MSVITRNEPGSTQHLNPFHSGETWSDFNHRSLLPSGQPTAPTANESLSLGKTHKGVGKGVVSSNEGGMVALIGAEGESETLSNRVPPSSENGNHAGKRGNQIFEGIELSPRNISGRS